MRAGPSDGEAPTNAIHQIRRPYGSLQPLAAPQLESRLKPEDANPMLLHGKNFNLRFLDRCGATQQAEHRWAVVGESVDGAPVHGWNVEVHREGDTNPEPGYCAAFAWHKGMLTSQMMEGLRSDYRGTARGLPESLISALAAAAGVPVHSSTHAAALRHLANEWQTEEGQRPWVRLQGRFMARYDDQLHRYVHPAD